MELLNGIIKNQSKICGFQINNLMNENSLSKDLFEEMIAEALNKKKVSKPIKQVRKIMDKNELMGL